MPPIKFKPSQTVRDRATGKNVTSNFFMKSTKKEELFDYINSSNGQPKIKQKCMNELTRRKIDIVWVDPKE